MQQQEQVGKLLDIVKQNSQKNFKPSDAHLRRINDIINEIDGSDCNQTERIKATKPQN